MLEQAALVEIAPGVGRSVLGQGTGGQSGGRGVGLVGQNGAGPGGEGFDGRVYARGLLQVGGQEVQGLAVPVAGAFSFQGGQD